VLKVGKRGGPVKSRFETLILGKWGTLNGKKCNIFAKKGRFF
jgi:hypothetical protein